MPKYATLFQRTVAVVADFVLVPLLVGVPFGLLGYASWKLTIVLSVPVALVLPAYNVALHRIWGQSVGKMLVGIRGETTRGGPLSWREAVRRYIPLTVYGVLKGAAFAVTVAAIPADRFLAASWTARGHLLSLTHPPQENALNLVSFLWLVVALIVFVNSARKQTIHDFIAGTVVVVDDRGAGFGRIWPTFLPVMSRLSLLSPR